MALEGLDPTKVTNLDALPVIPAPIELTDIVALYRTGLPAPAYQGTVAQLIALVNAGGTTVIVTASENIAAGAMVNIWNNVGTPNGRNANGTAHGKPTHGFAVGAATMGNPVTVAFFGLVSPPGGGLTPGAVFMAAGSGTVSSAPLNTAGQTSQQVGVCADPAGIAFIFQPQTAVNL